MVNTSTPLFNWRLSQAGLSPEKFDNFGGEPSLCRGSDWDCGFCGNPLHSSFFVNELGSVANYLVCHLCGFVEWTISDGNYGQPWYAAWTELRAFSLDEPGLALNELGAYLVRRRADIRFVSPWQLEQLVAHAFREHGLQLELTRQTRDGGFDLMVFSDGGNVAALIEIKHWRGAVGVEEVRKLRGVQLRENVGEVVLVTSGRFTEDARREAAAPYPISLGYKMRLMDGNDLIRVLDIFRDEYQLIPAATDPSKMFDSTGCADFSTARKRHSGRSHAPAGTEIALAGRFGTVVGHTRTGKLARICWTDSENSLLAEPVLRRQYG